MKTIKASALLGIVVTLTVLALAACGSSGGSGVSVGGLKQTGPGLTEPTNPGGAKQTGGTVTWSEGPSAAPNYIFPMTAFADCSTANAEQFAAMMYRPLYWYGSNYKPTVDYNKSLAQKPVFSDGDKTVSITLNKWKWSNGEPVTARDAEFYINVYKGDPAKNYCGYAPGLFPDNVKSMSTPNPQTLVLHLDRAYNPEWFTYNELSQVTPMPLEWDRTSLSQPAQKTDNGHLPDAQGKGQAEAVYNFLDAQAKKQSSYAKSPLWSIVDGPWKLQSDTTSGQFTYVPNKAYSGPNKPTISKFVEIPFTNDSAEFNQISSGGPKSLTIAGLPQQYVKKLPQLKSAGYLDNTAASYSVNYFPLNFHNPKMGAVFSQLYFRQAFQHLVDQPVWASKVLYNTGVPTYGPIPSAPPSPLTASGAAKNPYPFDPNAAATLLKAHGWKVVPNGTDTCTDPSKCGQGVKKGQKLSFTLDYQQGVATNTSEMQDLQTEAKKVGINVSLTTHPFQQVVAAGVPCTANQPQCKWQAENWGAGWIFSPDFLPTGELLFKKGAASDASSYSDPKADNLIRQTIYGPQKSEAQALTNYANYMAKTLPVVWGPTSIGSYVAGGGTLVSNKLGGYTANAYGYLEPEDWYLTK